MRLSKALAAAALLALPAGAASAAQRDILATAGEAGTFSRLIAAAEKAGLTDKLAGPGPITVFAPTDEAFAKLGADFVDYITKPENKDELAALLKSHVVEGKHLADALKAKAEPLDTLHGGTLAIDASAGLKVGNATVKRADIIASNGVIHAIDTVIEPSL